MPNRLFLNFSHDPHAIQYGYIDDNRNTRVINWLSTIWPHVRAFRKINVGRHHTGLRFVRTENLKQHICCYRGYSKSKICENHEKSHGLTTVLCFLKETLKLGALTVLLPFISATNGQKYQVLNKF